MLEKAEGTVQKIAGRVQKAVGDLADDPDTRAEGQAREVVGYAQELYGGALDQVRESAVRNPLGTVALIGAVGFILGAMWTKR